MTVPFVSYFPFSLRGDFGLPAPLLPPLQTAPGQLGALIGRLLTSEPTFFPKRTRPLRGAANNTRANALSNSKWTGVTKVRCDFLEKTPAAVTSKSRQ
jgi:hypothetical protein